MTSEERNSRLRPPSHSPRCFTGAAFADGTVNIYTYRQPELIQPVLDAFTAETGIKTEVLFLDKGLEERVAAEGQNSPADVIMTVDIARLTKAKEKGITQALDDATINANAAGRIPRSGRPLVRRHQARARRSTPRRTG